MQDIGQPRPPTDLIRDLVYGVSGAGKTSWWLRLASYLFQTQGLKTRWYLGDGGGTTITVSGAQDFVEVMAYNLWDNPFETMQRICEGWWPGDPSDPTSPLQPPSRDELAQYGLFVYEGLSVGSDYMMGDRKGGLAYRMARGEKLNNDVSFAITDGGMKFGGNARTHYGFVQRRIVGCIEATRALPVHVGWTAHERKVEDADYKETWIGPDVSGQILTTKIGASFGNTIHLHPVRRMLRVKDPVTKKDVERVEIERRAYTRTHYDPEAQHYVKYYANTRLPEALARIDPNFMAEFVVPDPLIYYADLQRARTQGKVLEAEAFKTLTLTL